MLSTLPSSLVQLGAKGEVIARYLYQDIEAICLVSDYDGGFALFHGGSGRMHLFALAKRDELLRLISENANNFLGLNLKVRKKTITLDQFRENRLGRFSNDVSITSLSEFTVNKLSPRHGNQPVQRIFATSETCIIERDPATYSVITVRALADVNVLVRWPDDPQRFSIEYIRGDTRTYLSTERDSMLATLLDSIRAAGNRNVCVQIHRSLRGERFSPLAQPPDEEVIVCVWVVWWEESIVPMHVSIHMCLCVCVCMMRIYVGTVKWGVVKVSRVLFSRVVTTSTQNFTPLIMCSHGVIKETHTQSINLRDGIDMFRMLIWLQAAVSLFLATRILAHLTVV